MTAVSETPGATYVWSFPGNPGTLAQSSIPVNTLANTSTTLIANYTITVTNPNNQCITRSVVPMYQNLFPPTASVTSGGTNSLTCLTPTIVLTNQSRTNIPPATGFPTNSIIVGYLWEGPTPQLPLQLATTYVASIVGDYTLTAMDLNNGCTASTIIPIGDFRQFPVLNNPVAPPQAYLDCGNNSSVTIRPIITTPTAALSYEWSAPPGAIVGTNTLISLITKAPGIYTVVVTNTLNSCVASTTMSVLNGSLTSNIAVDRSSGFAPLTVNFVNNSSTTTNDNSGIITIWTFGNGGTLTALQASVSPSTTYHQPGTYSVTAYVIKGTCKDSVTKVIDVEIPSQIIVPNVFSPNGDGVNDLFFLQRGENLTDITAEIYDRWGKKVYELTTSKGQIEWDGKNQYGKEVPSGTYFYIIKATGKDGVEYDLKGNVTLVR